MIPMATDTHQYSASVHQCGAIVTGAAFVS